MSKLEVLTGRDYLSYSSLSSYLDCGERFRLERVLNAPQSNAWWFLGGNAVHTASEVLDRGEEEDPTAAWEAAWEERLSTLIPGEVVKAGGRATKAFPDKENRDWWEANGPNLVSNWVKWRDARFAEGWMWLPLPDGKPSIEVPVQVVFNEGTDDQVLVKGYIDRVAVNDDGEVVVVDLKSGSRQPASSLQLGIYGLGLLRNFGIGATLGGYWMARTGEMNKPTSLLHYTNELVGKWFGNAQRGIEAEVFIPHVGPFCGGCSVAPYCSAVGGSDLPLRGNTSTA